MKASDRGKNRPVRIAAWTILLVSTSLLVACVEKEPLPGAGPSKTYRHAMDGAPGSLDPARASSIYANFLALNLYDTLYRYRYLARPYELTTNLADTMPEVSADGLVYTIRIKRGVRFIDDPAFADGTGRELTAHDFVYSIKRHFDPGSLAQGAWLWQDRIAGLDEWKQRGPDYNRQVSGLQALDDYTIRITLTRPFPQLVHTLAQGYSAIVPREAVERYGREFSNHPVGSGPFSLVSIDSARAILKRNPGFRAEPFSLRNEGFDAASQSGLGLEALEGRSPPFLDRLQIEFIAEDAARWNALVSGDVQFIKVPVTQFDRVLQSRDPIRVAPEFMTDFRFEASQESGFVYTNFNLADERIGYHPDPAQDTRNRALRCAIVKAFDWRRRNEVFYYGIGQVFPGVIPPVAPEHDPAADTAYVQRDLAGALRLLSKHGWNAEDLPVLEYGFPSSVTERQMFEQFRSFMADIGYPEEKVQPLTFATYGDYARAYAQRRVMLVTSSWTMDYPDAENTMQLFYGPNGSPGSNSSNYNNAQYDRLYRRSAAMQPSEERTSLYRSMNQMVIDDCASISGIARTLLFLWDRDAIMLPDRSFVGGYFFRFVDMHQPNHAGQ
jgi:ABC-type transport system substrate-binding protein